MTDEDKPKRKWLARYVNPHKPLTEKEICLKIENLTGLNRAEVRLALSAYHAVIYDQIVQGRPVRFPGVGTINPKEVHDHRFFERISKQWLTSPVWYSIKFQGAQELRWGIRRELAAQGKVPYKANRKNPRPEEEEIDPLLT